MVFTSVIYFLFLAVVVGAVFSLPKRHRPLFLLAVSYIFYMYWKPAYVLIIIALTLLDYALAPLIERHQGKLKRSIWLASVFANLGVLFVFKYLGFFAREWNELADWLLRGGQISVPQLILPIGISFHTFQAIAYMTDVYRGEHKAERNLVHFALFITWFPQLVAGPIERAHSLLGQLKEINLPDSLYVREALFWLAWGLFKKLVVADNLAALVDPVYANPAQYSQWLSLAATYGYAFQIYCDFSGYTDIAIGSSLLFGIRLTENFNRPYLSRSFVEFWKRWHISLSSWFFEYVFFPLARRFPTQGGLSFAIVTVFLLSGIWHGANWTFAIWGLLNGLIYLGYVLWQRRFPISDRGPAGWAAVLINFHLVCLCWIFFRARSVADANSILANIFFFRSGDPASSARLVDTIRPEMISGGIGLAVLFVHALLWRKYISRLTESWPATVVYAVTMLIVLSAFGQFASEGFIYFQF